MRASGVGRMAAAWTAVTLLAAPATTRAEPVADPGPNPDAVELLVFAADLGYRVVNVQEVEFDDADTADVRLVPSGSGGVSPALGVGMRFLFLTLMLRGDVTMLRDNPNFGGELWNLDLEATLRFLVDRLQPYLLFGAGYSTIGGLGQVVDGDRRDAVVHGANGRFGIGFDYYLSEALTVGVRGHVDGYLLSSRVTLERVSRAETVDSVAQVEERLLEAEGSALGYSYGLGLVLGIHLL